MPKIPTYTPTVDYKPQRGDLETAALPGQMLAKFGAAVGTFGDTIFEHQQKQEKAALDSAVKSARDEITRANSTAQWLDELHKTVESFRADTEPQTMMERFKLRIGNLGQDVAAGIGDPQVRAQVEQDMSRSIGVQSALLQADSLRRLSSQGRQDLDAHLDRLAGIAADARHPLEHDEAVDLAVGEIQRKARAGFLTEADAANIEQGFYADLAERQARHAIAADPQGALASLKGGEDFATLPADRRTRLIDEADRAVQAQAVSSATGAAALRRDALIRLPRYIGSLRDGDLPDDDSFSREGLIATLGEEEGAKRWGEIEDARVFGKAMAPIRWAAPDEIARKLAPYGDPTAPNDATPDRSLLLQAVGRRNEQLWSRPADYVLTNPRIAELHDSLRQATAQPKLPAALTSALQTSGALVPVATPSDEDRRAATAAYANATLAEQERLGLPADRRQVLPEAEAQELVARILDGDPETAGDTLSDLAADWGDAWPNALADLTRTGLPGEYRLLASLVDPAARQTFAKVLTAQNAEPGALRNKAGADAEMMDGLLRTALHPLGGRSDNRSIIQVSGAGGTPRQRTPTSSQANPPSPSTNVPARRPYSGDNFPRRNAVDLTDRNGTSVMSIDEAGNPQQVQIPEGVDLSMFVRMGEEDRKAALTGPGKGGVGDRMEFLKQRLLQFDQGGIWDLQRPGLMKDSSGKGYVNYSEFVNVATIAIGIYCAALGLPQYLALEGQRNFARKKSNFGSAKQHWYFRPLPERNVKNTEIGYDLYERGLVPGPAE